jgi:hypothetical protein
LLPSEWSFSTNFLTFSILVYYVLNDLNNEYEIAPDTENSRALIYKNAEKILNYNRRIMNRSAGGEHITHLEMMSLHKSLRSQTLTAWRLQFTDIQHTFPTRNQHTIMHTDHLPRFGLVRHGIHSFYNGHPDTAYLTVQFALRHRKRIECPYLAGDFKR